MCLFYFIILALHAQYCCSTSDFNQWIKGNSINLSSFGVNVSKVPRDPLPVDTMFNFPSPLPKWPPGGGFGSGVIDLGGLQVCQVSAFTKVWATHEGGKDNLGATFYDPSPIPDGFFMLGSYSQPNNKPLSGWVIAVKDLTNDAILAMPIDYKLIWSSDKLKIKQDGVGYIWVAIPPDGYRSIGHVITSSPQKPSLDKIRCVRSDFIVDVHHQKGTWIWSDHKGFDIHGLRLDDGLSHTLGFPSGSFVVSNDGISSVSSAYLKNVNKKSHAMPNLEQIKALFKEYSPLIYFHPDEEFFPSSVNWFFHNGALLYSRPGSTFTRIRPNGTNLPQGGSNDGAFWIDLPPNQSDKNRIAKGNLQSATVYLHAKPVQGGAFTDLAVWVFYPYNGASRAKVLFVTFKLGRIGEHVGDWEHVTLRINNFDGKLASVFYSQHNKGQWVSASDVTYKNGNKPVVYASLHGHAAYPTQGDHLLGSKKVGIRDDAKESNTFLDTGKSYEIVSANYFGKGAVIEPPWLNFAREWGPKITYKIDNEINDVAKHLPKFLRKLFRKFIAKIPTEFLGEEGPLGPKSKDDWK